MKIYRKDTAPDAELSNYERTIKLRIKKFMSFDNFIKWMMPNTEDFKYREILAIDDYVIDNSYTPETGIVKQSYKRTKGMPRLNYISLESQLTTIEVLLDANETQDERDVYVNERLQ